MSWYVLNNLRDSSSIAPRTIRKTKKSPKPRKQKVENNLAHPQWNTKDWLIECKRPEYNFPKDADGKVGEETKLASHAWFNRHSNGDYFTIHPTEKPSDVQSFVTEGFDKLGLRPEILSAVNDAGFQHPTLVQCKSVQPLLAGRNTVIAAETGCGKTLAYLLPVMQQVLEWKQHFPNNINTPLALILTPNRELVYQTYGVAKRLAENLSLTPFKMTGGKTKRMIQAAKFDPMDILIATPSVVNKLTATKILDLTNVRHVVMDEADTLLDDSFNWYIKAFLRKISIYFQSVRKPGSEPVGAQLTLASATMPQDVAPILSDFLEEDSFEMVVTPGLHKLMPQVKQTFMRMGKIHKSEQLLKTVKQLQASKTPTLIFSNKTTTSRFITLFLKEHNVDAPCFCADMRAEFRQETFNKFQSGQSTFLSTTDIASRGLDTLKAQVILNYDFPVYMADYLHRCGRVGRIGSDVNGRVISFVNGPAEIKNVQAIERSTRTKEPLPNVNGNIKKLIQRYEDAMDEKEINEEIRQMAH
ncbi:Hypothetical predicted protein [Cloeon dipterum]|uniref:RNA helicase n=1 Tax=Cloeon dipterum TaxID=197152 RepID=A0A8S1DJT0_9INSE|nr:Hypothetical predicted protein [Cloeon dipterum]